MTGRDTIRLAALCVLVGLALVNCLAAAPPVFTRVFAPVERIGEWPLDGDKYLPVPAAEFERIAQLLERGQSGLATTRRCRIERLTGDASIESGLLRGTLRLDIAQHSAGTALLTLDPCQVAISDARWETPTDAPAIVGMTSGGRTAAVVERGGRLRIDFTLRPTTGLDGSEAYELRVPSTTSATWTIAAPVGAELQVEGGLSSSPGGHARPAYHVDVEPGATLRLLVGDPASTSGNRPWASVVQTLNYNVAADGVEVISDFRVTEARVPQRSWTIALDPELQPVSVALAGQSLLFRQAPEQGERHVIEVESPTPLDTDHTLRVTAWCPLRVGERWKLPGILLTDARWNDGAVNLLLPEPLGLTELYASYGLRQTRIGHLTLPKPGAMYAFDAYAADARLEVRLDQRVPRIMATSGVTAEVGPRETTARMLSDIQVTDGEVFTFHGRIAPDWLIDDVTSLTAQSVAEVATDPADDRRLIVRLNRSANPRQGVRLAVTARRLNPRGGENLALEAFEPIVWEQATPADRYFALRGAGEQRWRLRLEEGAEFVTRDQLANAALELLPPAADETLVALTGDGGAVASLVARPQRLRVKTLAEYTVTAAGLQEYYSFDCAPEQNSVESLLVRFSQRRDGEPTWTVADAAGVTASATRLTNEHADPADHTELWQVRIWPPRTGPFVLQAVRSAPFAGSAPIALAELPGADDRGAAARILADAEWIVETEVNGPRPVFPAATSPQGENRSTRAEFRYDPSRDVNRSAPPALTISAHMPAANESRVIVRHEATTTIISPSGECLVAAHYGLDNDAAGRLTVVLPPDATPLGLTRDGAPLAFERQRDELHVDIAALGAKSDVRLEYSVDRADQLRAGGLASILPQLPGATHPRRWQLGIPSDWELSEIQAPWKIARPGQHEIVRRLLGPWARGHDSWSPLGWLTSTTPETSSGDVFVRPEISAGNWIELTGPSHGAPILRLRQHSESRRYFTCAALLAGVLGWRLGRWRSAAWLAIPACAAFAALVFPVAWIPWTSGAFLGALVATLLLAPRSIAPATTPPFTAAGSTTRTMVLGTARSLTIFLLLLGTAAHAVEEQPARSPRVFVPIDAERNPTGDRYFVSAGLWRAMLTQAARLGDETPAWLITDARYSLGDRDAPADTESLLRVVLELRTFVADANVSLPPASLPRTSWEHATLDGLPLSAPPNEANSEWQFSVAEPGLHRVELSLRPLASELHGQLRFDGPSFPVPNATLRVWHDPSSPSVEVNSLGEQLRNITSGLLTAALGPATSWRLQFTEAPATATLRSAAEVEQLLWLVVEPERVTAEVRHRIVAADRPVGRLEVQIDPRWELTSVTSSGDPPTPRAGSSPDRLQLDWNAPAAVGERFTLLFQLKDRSGVGEIALPSITPVGVVVRRRWCAVTLDPALETTSLVNTGGSVLSTAQFLSSWGAQPAAPSQAFTWPQGSPLPNLQTAFTQPVNVAGERQDVVVHAGRIDVHFDAMIDTATTPVFQHVVQCPRSLIVESADIEQEGARQPARWSRGENGAVHVFLPSATVGPHRMAIRGSVPAAPGEAIPLPQLTLLDAEVRSRVVGLFQGSSALVDQAEPAPRAATEAATAHVKSAALLGEWTLPSSRQSITFRLRANRPRTTLLQTISPRETTDGTEVEVDCRLSIADGTVDALRWGVPNDWQGPFAMEPAWPYQLKAAPGAQESTLVVRPPQTLSGERQFRFRGPITAASGGIVTLPTVDALDFGRVQRVVILPDFLSGRRVSWQLEGLRPATLPSTWSAPREMQSTWKAYEVTGETYHAAARPVDSPQRAPRVRLADHTLRVEDDGAYRGLSVFSVSPGGLSQLPLQLPAGARIESCRILKRRVTLRAGEADTWLIPLLSDHLPQQIEVLYAGRLDTRQSTSAPAPRFLNTPVDATQWRIVGPYAERVRSTSSRTSPMRLELSRYQASVDVIEAGLEEMETIASSPSDAEERRWLMAALAGSTASRANALRATKSVSDRVESRHVLSEIDNLDQRLRDAAQDQLAMQTLIDEAINAADREVQNAAPDDLTSDLSQIALRDQSSTGATPVLAPASTVSESTLARVLIAAVLLAAAALLIRGRTVAARAAKWTEWRSVVWLVLGAVLAIWASPSLLGIGLLGYALLRVVSNRGLRELPAEMAR